jgi:hypothetical protein
MGEETKSSKGISYLLLSMKSTVVELNILFIGPT